MPDELASILRAIAAATPETVEPLYHLMLGALGNNHAGTYLPVALTVVPFFAEILRDGSPAAQQCVLEVLIDLVGSFSPAPEIETFEVPGQVRPLRDRLHDAVRDLTPDLQRLATAPDAPPEEARRIAELLGLLIPPH